VKVILEPKDYPLEIPIGEKTYQVVFCRKLPGAYGMCESKNAKLILLALDQCEEELLASFWHEALHAMSDEANLKLSHPLIRKLEYLLAEVHLAFMKKRGQNGL
jgi:hypothetical protein